MIGRVIRTTDNGRIKRDEDRQYIDVMFAYTNGLHGRDGLESRHRTHRPYVVAYPETKLYIESAAFPLVTDPNDIVIAFRDRGMKRAFDRFRRTWARRDGGLDVDAEGPAVTDARGGPRSGARGTDERKAKTGSRAQSSPPEDSHQLGLFGDNRQT